MSTASAHQSQIVADPDVPLVRITREFDAAPEKVFRAHADPDLLLRWMGPGGHQMRVEHYDCRTGGRYRYMLVSDGNEFAFRGCFHDVRPGELIVQTFTFEGQPDGVALERMTFQGIDRGRTLLTATSLVESFRERDAFLAGGMQDGVREGYERLDSVLAG